MLAQERKAELTVDDYVVAIGVAVEEPKAHADVEKVVEAIQHAQRFLVQLHSLGCSLAVGLRELREPHGAATVATVNVGNSGKACREAPGVKEVGPVDVVGNFV